MSDVAATPALSGLVTFLEEVENEREVLEQLAASLAGDRPGLDAEPVDRHLANSMALETHGWFTAVEAVFERIARTFDGTPPAGPDSHAALLFQMKAAMPGRRPSVLSEESRAGLDQLRRFRHFVRHGYGVPIDPEHLRRRVDGLLHLHPLLMAQLATFVGFCHRTRDILAATARAGT